MNKEFIVPPINNIKYKGIHPIEKKKTIQKINLLINKFNSADERLYNKGLEIVATEKMDDVLTDNGLDAYRGISLSYLTDFHMKSIKKLESMLESNREDFKKFIKSLTTSGKTLEEINKETEMNKYWKLYDSSSDGKHIKVNAAAFNEFSKNFEKTLKSSIQKYAASTILIIKTYLLEKEKEKLKDSKELLEKFIKILEAETDKTSYTKFQKKEINNLVSTFKSLTQIIDSKKGNLTGTQIKALNQYFKGERAFETTNSVDMKNLKEKYFLPMMQNVNKETKKMILVIMSMATDVASGEKVTKTILANISKISH